MTMADEKTARYVAYIDSLITVSPKSQSAISREIGYKNPNILSLIKKGRIPLPVEKVLPLAEALNADPVRLMMMVLEDRQPELADFLRDQGIAPLTPKNVRFSQLSATAFRLKLMVLSRLSKQLKSYEKFTLISSVDRRSPFILWSISSKSGCSTIDEMYDEKLSRASRI